MLTRNLNPGGRIEMIDILYPLRSDDGTLTKDSASFKWSELLLDIFTKNNTPMDSAFKYKEQLEEAGFVDINIVKRKWPTNHWPKDSKHKQIGQYNISTVNLRDLLLISIYLGLWTQQNALDALEALSLAVFTRPEGRGGLGWSKEEVGAFLLDVRKDIKNVNIHSYWPM